MTGTHCNRLQKFAAALAVVLFHAVMIRAFLEIRGLFAPAIGPPAPAMTWIILPPASPVTRAVPAPSPSRALAMVSLLNETNRNPVTALNVAPRLNLQLIPPLLLPQPNVQTLTLPALAADLGCTFEDYDRLTESEKSRCALRLSSRGTITALPVAYEDQPAIPLSLFGANGTFQIMRPADGVDDPRVRDLGIAAACAWDRGICRLPIQRNSDWIWKILPA